jgi:fibronectin type 3 domain-containing protein
MGVYEYHLQVAPAAPTQLVIKPTGNNIELFWLPSAGAQSYKIYRATTPDVPIIFGNLLATSTATNYTDNGVLAVAEKCFYAVTAEGN